VGQLGESPGFYSIYIRAIRPVDSSRVLRIAISLVVGVWPGPLGTKVSCPGLRMDVDVARSSPPPPPT